MKCMMLILDGAADRPLKELGGRTPLEAAKAPNLAALASKGVNGILDPVSPGRRVGSDTTHLALLGYDPEKVYSGRGPFEALGIGVPLKEGDIALRCNFATVDDEGIVIDRRAGRISEGNSELAWALNGLDVGEEFVFRESVGHRGVLVLRNKAGKFGPGVSDSDPHRTGEKILKVVAIDGSKEAENTARFLNKFSGEALRVLRNHEINLRRARNGKPKANAVLLRGCGRAVKLSPFQEKYSLRGGCMATVGIIKGIAIAAEMEVLKVPGGYQARVKQALADLEDLDFLLLNIKETDEAAHDHDARKKVKLIEEIDNAIEPLIGFSEDNYVAVLSDHTTSTSYGDHTGDPVPLLIAGPEVRADDVMRFDERSVSRGGLGRIRGLDLMPVLVDLMNKSEKYGA